MLNAHVCTVCNGDTDLNFECIDIDMMCASVCRVCLFKSYIYICKSAHIILDAATMMMMMTMMISAIRLCTILSIQIEKTLIFINTQLVIECINIV